MDNPPVVCANCGTTNEAGRKFCAECGKGLGVACAGCGTLNQASVKFCGECGSAMQAGATPGTATAPTAGAAEAGAERRLVSVLFADLVGFTTLAEGRDAEETRELLTGYFDLARGVIERHGGTVEKFIGDAVMAVWGAPTAHEDDAERAVRSALELVAAVPALGDEAHPIQARAGVFTGEAAVTIGATNQGIVAGDMVNTASRLQSAAAPGAVLVGEATMRAASTAIAFEEAGEQTLKGKALAIPAWRATAVVAMRGGTGRRELLEPPFVGRDDELRLLKDQFDATARERKSRLITVIGEAGIGKSRLAWEFEKYLDGVVDTANWHEGRSPSYGDGISYWALAEMVRRRAGAAEGDDEETARAALTACLERYVPDPTERRWITPRLLGLLGIEELPAEGREELFAAWRTFFVRVAQQNPVIMVFTDLHWADQGMLDFVENLLNWARTEPIFVIALARPELLDRRPDWGSSVRSVTRVHLESLPDAQIAQMLEGMVPGLPAAALRQIVGRAEGIPLYAVETVRMLLDRELLVPEEGRYRLVGDIGSIGVAETLQALIASRLDAAKPEDRSVLQDASVLGQSFTLDALVAVSGKDPPSLAEPLERLVRSQMLTVDADPRSPERGQYQFVQAVVREVAYASLARGDRRTRHLAAARFLEGLGEEEAVGVLASHYFAAYQASRAGDEADALAAQARIALQAAAERAASLHSHTQAVGYLEQAIAITTDPAEQAALYLRATESGEASADLTKAIEHARLARELYRTMGDLPGVLRAATWLGRHHTTTKLEGQAVTIFEEARAESEDLAESAEYAALLAELSRVYMMTGRAPEAVDTADRSLILAGHHVLIRPVVEALINKGTALMIIGRRTEAAALLRGAAAEADRYGLSQASLRARNNLLGITLADDLKGGDALEREGYDLAIRLENGGFVQQFLMLLGFGAIRLGEWGAWMKEIEALEETETIHPFYRLGFAQLRAILAALRGDHERASAQMEIARAAGQEMDSRLGTAALEVGGAQIALVQGDWTTAARQALAAGKDDNFSVDGPDLAAQAAVAGALDAKLAEAITMLRAQAQTGRVAAAALAAAEAGQLARSGRWEDARAGYRKALTLRHETSDLQGGAFDGLIWGLLAGDRDPEAKTAQTEAEAFFAWRGGTPMVNIYKAAFVPVTRVSAAAPPASLTRSEVPAAK
ncbi:MAG: adenylate/guanylate cyclase domain-containing protein, partial [Chloroflexota bacterium]